MNFNIKDQKDLKTTNIKDFFNIDRFVDSTRKNKTDNTFN